MFRSTMIGMVSALFDNSLDNSLDYFNQATDRSLFKAVIALFRV